MNDTQETVVLKSENDNLLPLLAELQVTVLQAAQQGTPIHQVELAIWKQILRIGNQALGQFLALLGTGDQGETVTLPDGHCCRRLDELHARRYVSIFGNFTLQRTVYGSREGQTIEFVPLDNRLQLPQSVFSYVLQDWDQSFCVEQAFGPSAEVIKRILGLQLSVDSLERTNVEMGSRVMDYLQERSWPKAEEEGPILVTSGDGKGVVMRREGAKPKAGHLHKGEKAKQKRMAIVGAAYTVKRYVRTAEEVVAALFGDEASAGNKVAAKPRPRPQHKHLWASLAMAGDAGESISGIDVVYTWLQEEVLRRNPKQDKELVHLCDGQEALWEAATTYLPQKPRVNILDLLHVASRIWQAAHAFHREGSDGAEQFVRERLLRILQGESVGVVRGLRQMATKHGLKGTKKKTVTKVCNYLEANKERMRYDEYLAKGYPIASGVIEGACRHLVKDRMERAGMHWTMEGAQAMLNVRSVNVEGEWEAFQAYRIKQETESLYPFKKVVEGDNYHMAV